MNARLVCLIVLMVWACAAFACGQCSTCSVTASNFPLSAQVSSGGDDYVILTESTTCTVTGGTCVITGTITF